MPALMLKSQPSTASHWAQPCHATRHAKQVNGNPRQSVTRLPPRWIQSQCVTLGHASVRHCGCCENGRSCYMYSTAHSLSICPMLIYSAAQHRASEACHVLETMALMHYAVQQGLTQSTPAWCAIAAPAGQNILPYMHVPTTPDSSDIHASSPQARHAAATSWRPSAVVYSDQDVITILHLQLKLHWSV
jgi:hypothetical protein